MKETLKLSQHFDDDFKMAQTQKNWYYYTKVQEMEFFFNDKMCK